MTLRSSNLSPTRSGSGSPLGSVLSWCLAGGLALASPREVHGADAGTTPKPPQAHWSFQPLTDPPAPPVSYQDWARGDLDAFVLQGMERAGVKPLPRADKLTLIRRATFDLTGLPPAPEEVQAFLADDSPQAFTRVVDRLLNSPRYGEHWGRHWLDVVRYADTAGETADYPVPVAWRYRNYVIDAFNADKPYDRFLQEQIAGDILGRQGSPEQYAERITATGYLAISRRFGFDSENYHHLTIQDTIDNLGQTVLGLTLGCARCHDHKYDPVSMADYYGLYGIFESSRYAFPGSEQKQKYRAMAPLAPPEAAKTSWGNFDERIAALIRKLDRNKQPPPPAVLRSLADMDGDFEMQAIAAGGSRGVLVAPWIYEGPISVTREAQSPYGNLYPLGKAGVSLPAGTNAYQFGQSLYPNRTHEQGGLIYANLDLKLGAADPKLPGRHRIWLGARGIAEMASLSLAHSTAGIAPALPAAVRKSPAIEILVSTDSLALVTGDGEVRPLAPVKPGTWNNLQLVVDLAGRKVSGELHSGAHSTAIPETSFRMGWNGSLNFIGFETETSGKAGTPGLELDNIGIRETPIPRVSGDSPGKDQSAEPTIASLNEEIARLAGMDAGFDVQTPDAAPSSPWGPGPNSAVKISRKAQSPYTHLLAGGESGIRLPGGSAYNGFGQTLTNAWKPARQERLHAAFDFRARADTSAEGSWRMYLGHGPGSSPALELFLNDRQLSPRNGDSRAPQGKIVTNTWYHVQVTLNLKEKSYTGWFGTPHERTEFKGAFATGWDGTIDYTFIDSYGHIGGNKPVLEVDNYVVREESLPDFTAQAVVAEGGAARRQRIAELRRQVDALNAELDQAKQELTRALSEGPGEMTYAVVEGTPRNARIQLRGEQDRLGDEVPRGFLKILGGDRVPEASTGSGRLELAQWVTRKENPLTARVMMNRVWQYHFGRALVPTPNDFGLRGQRPTHPELLDFLASRFLQSGWSIKAMHRLIMNSATYQQHSAPAGAATAELYTGFSRQRLTAESLRDSILWASGELDERPGQGHPFPSPTSWGFSQHGPFSGVYDHNRRSIYLMTQRIKRHPFLALFDGADPNGSTPTRSVSTVPTQALYFMNDAFVHDKARKLALRLEKSAQEENEQIRLAFQWALGRQPHPVEQTEVTRFLEAYRAELNLKSPEEARTTALAALARTLFASNEFLHVD